MWLCCQTDCVALLTVWLCCQVQRREETIPRRKKQSAELQEVISKHEQMSSQQNLTVDQLQSQVKSLTSQLSSQTESKLSVEAELGELQKRHAQREERVGELETQISDLQHELSTSRVNTETLLAKVSPCSPRAAFTSQQKSHVITAVAKRCIHVTVNVLDVEYRLM